MNVGVSGTDFGYTLTSVPLFCVVNRIQQSKDFAKIFLGHFFFIIGSPVIYFSMRLISLESIISILGVTNIILGSSYRKILAFPTETIMGNISRGVYVVVFGYVKEC